MTLTIENIGDFLAKDRKLDFDESFDLSKFCSQLLRTKETERIGRDIIIRILDKWDDISENTKIIWNELIDSAGLYPYINNELISNSSAIRFEYHKSQHLNNVYLHDEQLLISYELLNKKSVALSAPTSFGKSLLIEEVVASKIYSEIVIIQPTLALLDETRKKLRKYGENYKIIVSTSQEPDPTRPNIYLFTGERVLDYEKFKDIDFFIIDEFYKLSLQREDDRAIILNQAFSKLLRKTNKFYMLGPVIKAIPLNFQEKFNFRWFPTDFATVSVDEHNIDFDNKLKSKQRKELKKKKLFEFLMNCKDQTLIYCSSPAKATSLSLELLIFLEENSYVNHPTLYSGNDSMKEWITQNIHSHWLLVKALSYGIAFHHGALPRHLGSSIIDSFNNASIKFLFCTSTLMEGVNTSAKNVLLYDNEKGNQSIDFFDYKNIAGRSGRMKKHFVGNVYRFEKQPDQLELFLDIPLFNQSNAPLELLISLNESELEKKPNPELANFHSLSEDLKETIKKNSGASIQGQIDIINEIENNIKTYHPLLSITTFPPSYDTLNLILTLGWNYLLKPKENKADIRSPQQLSVLTLKYLKQKNINNLIKLSILEDFWIKRIPNEPERINYLTFFILNVSRHWFNYKLPKWINVISNLQEYVFKKNNLSYGNYKFLASSLEHSFLSPNLAALLEYDIPTSAILKLTPAFDTENNVDQILIKLTNMTDAELKKRNLIDYEVEKIRNAI